MRVCPICGEEYDLHPALSRRDNRTEICPSCGMVEALEDFGLSGEPVQVILQMVSETERTAIEVKRA